MAKRYESLVSPVHRRARGFQFPRSSSQTLTRILPHSTRASLSPQKSSLFPPWLLSRKDFQDLSAQYGNLSSIDVWEVCRKPPANRNKLEKRAVLVWLADSPFLAEMKDYQLAEVCDRFQSQEFEQGAVLVRKGEPADCLYLLVEGCVGVYTSDDELADCVYPKNVVGELGVQFHALRTATVTALTAVKTFRLSLADYESVLFHMKLQHFKDHSRFLSNTAFFSPWDKGKVDRLAATMMVKSYRKGQAVYHTGEFAGAMFVVRTGCIALEMQTTLKRANQWPVSPTHCEVSTVCRVYQRTMRECGPGEVFGEAELLENCPRACIALAREDSLLFLIRKEDIEEAFTEKERSRLKKYHAARPPTEQVRDDLESEHYKAFFTRNALLNGIETNFLPSTRALPYKALRKQHLAQLFIQRHRSQAQRKLIRQDKTVEVIEGRRS